jgi:hypothetical protein
VPLLADASDVLTHWDELDFVEILGTRDFIVRLDSADGPSDAILLAVWYDPDVRLPAHSHACGHVEVILEGSLCVGDRWERAGSIRAVPPGFSYGPLLAGPQGCKAIEFFPDGGAFLAEFDDPSELVGLIEGEDPASLQAKLERLLGGPAPVSVFGG